MVVVEVNNPIGSIDPTGVVRQHMEDKILIRAKEGLLEVVLIRAKEPVFGKIKRLRKLKEAHLALKRLKETLAV